MGKNFIILIFVTFSIGIIFKYFFSFREFEDDAKKINIEFSLSEIDMILYNDPNLNFDKVLSNHLYELEQYFLNANYDFSYSKDYALANVYFLRYKEYIAARNLLSEINHNLYFEPRSIKHGRKIPILSTGLEELALTNTNAIEYYRYQKEISNTYGEYKLVDSDFFNMNPSDLIVLNDFEQGDLTIYNPYFYNQKAKKYFKKSISCFNDFLANYKTQDEYYFKASVRHELLNMYNNNLVEIFFENESIYENILNLLNNDYINGFQPDLVDFLIYAEKNTYLDLDEAKKLYKKIDNKSIKVLYRMKREIFDLKKINRRKIRNIECENFEDNVFPVELYIAESELMFRKDKKNNDFDWIDMADSNINDFWTKCITVYHQIDMEEVCDGCLVYNNYDYTLLTSFRLGLWHGGQLPVWNGRFNRVYTKTFDADIVDPSFGQLRDQIDLWMGAIIK